VEEADKTMEEAENVGVLLEGMTLRTRETVMRGVKTLDPILRTCYHLERNTCILAHGNQLRFRKLQKCRLVRRG
jgi:hypothetical protein